MEFRCLVLLLLFGGTVFFVVRTFLIWREVHNQPKFETETRFNLHMKSDGYPFTANEHDTMHALMSGEAVYDGPVDGEYLTNGTRVPKGHGVKDS